MSNRTYPLRDLFWECTLRCNAYCTFCGSRCGDIPSEELTTEEILSVFRDVANKMDPRQIMINVTGGEPLLRKDLFEVMRECVRMGFSWGVVTNGMLMTPKIVEKLKVSGMKTISVSLDGLQETHEALRGVKGGFDKVVNALKMLRQADFLEHIQVTTVVSRQNIGQLEEMYAFLKPLGLTSWRVAMVDPIGRAQENTQLLLDKADVTAYLDFIRKHRNDPELPVITTCSHYLGEDDRDLGRDHFVCRTGKNVASILANGDIFVCPNVPRRPEWIQGNVKTHSLPEVWKHGFQYFRNPDARKSTVCSDCPHWIACRGDSAHTWDQDNKIPNFCFRRIFPDSCTAISPALASILPKLKEQTQSLRGIRIRYGWEDTMPVIFTPNASRELYNYYHWGQRHPQNLSELLGALIGRKLSDCILVEFVSPVHMDKRNTREGTFTQVSLDAGYMEADAINVTYGQCPAYTLVDTPCSLLGFVHSHPDDLELFLSEADVAVHKLLLSRDLDLSMILNPQKRQMAAYYGANMTVAEIQLLMEASEISLWQITE